MKKNAGIFQFLVFLVLAMVLSACQGKVVGGIQAPTPNAGKSVVTGQVLSKDDKGPFRDTAVRLAAVYRQGNPSGTYILDLARSPGNFTDQNGFFVISDVDPGEYTIIVGDPESKYVVLSDEKGDATVIKTESTKILDVGTLRVSLARP